MFTLPDQDGTWALVETDVSLAEFRTVEDPDRVITLEPSAGEKNGDTVIVDGDEEDLYVITVDGEEIVAYRSRLTSGGRFQDVDDPVAKRWPSSTWPNRPSGSGPDPRTTPRSGPTRTSAARSPTRCW